MLLTIIMPVYNAEQFLKDSIDTVLMQTDKNYELIIIDDGSKDNSGIICDDFANKHQNIRVIHKENEGQSEARNLALTLARGEYIWFVDADDYISSDKAISFLSEALKKYHYPEILLFNTKTVYNNPSGKREIDNLYAPEYTEILTGREYVAKYKTMPTSVYAQWIKKSFIQKYNFRFLKEIFFEDWYFNLDLYYYAETIVGIPEIFYHYIKRENSTMTGNMGAKHLYSQVLVLNKIYTSLAEEKFDGFFLKNRIQYEYNYLKKIYLTNTIPTKEREKIIRKNLGNVKIPLKKDLWFQKFEKSIFSHFPIFVLNKQNAFGWLMRQELKIRNLIK